MTWQRLNVLELILKPVFCSLIDWEKRSFQRFPDQFLFVLIFQVDANQRIFAT